MDLAASGVTLVLLLWALVGMMGGGVAYRLANRLLEGPGSGGSLRPRCPRCGRTQSPLHRLALARLPCRGCGKRPPREQAVVEVIAATLVVLLRARLGDDLAVLVPAAATLVLAAATLTDLRARLIPNALTYPATALALAASPLPGGVGLLPALLGALVAGGLALVIWLAGRVLYRRNDAFGLGDVKLAAFVGAVVGLSRAPSAIVAGTLVGGGLGAAVLLAGRSSRATMPYGPALAVGAYLILLLGPP